jgi:hypothetical protein
MALMLWPNLMSPRPIMGLYYLHDVNGNMMMMILNLRVVGLGRALSAWWGLLW